MKWQTTMDLSNFWIEGTNQFQIKSHDIPLQRIYFFFGADTLRHQSGNSPRSSKLKLADVVWCWTLLLLTSIGMYVQSTTHSNPNLVSRDIDQSCTWILGKYHYVRCMMKCWRGISWLLIWNWFVPYIQKFLRSMVVCHFIIFKYYFFIIMILSFQFRID